MRFRRKHPSPLPPPDVRLGKVVLSVAIEIGPEATARLLERSAAFLLTDEPSNRLLTAMWKGEGNDTD